MSELSFLFPLLAGAGLALLSSYFGSRIQQRQDVTLRLLDKFFEARRDVVEAVAGLTHFAVGIPVEAAEREAQRDAITRLFYRHYDFLPRAVLDSLLLLQVALDRYDGNFYTVKDNTIVRMPASEKRAFVGSCSLFRNSEVFAMLILNGDSQDAKAKLAIAFHARDVLTKLNTFASPAKLLKLPKSLKKVLSNRKKEGAQALSL